MKFSKIARLICEDHGFITRFRKPRGPSGNAPVTSGPRTYTTSPKTSPSWKGDMVGRSKLMIKIVENHHHHGGFQTSTANFIQSMFSGLPYLSLSIIYTHGDGGFGCQFRFIGYDNLSSVFSHSQK